MLTPKTITKHLRDLEENKIIKRTVYPEVPPRVEYSLTERGVELIPLLKSIMEWGSQYMDIELEQLKKIANRIKYKNNFKVFRKKSHF